MPNEADKAKANDPNEAEAYEVDKAIVADAAIEANAINQIVAANKTIVTANKTIVIDKGIAVDKAIVIDKVIAVNKAILIDKAIVADKAKANKASWFCLCCLHSLTKYFAICAEVKKYFGTFGHNNQLLGVVWSCLRSLKCQHLLRAE